MYVDDLLEMADDTTVAAGAGTSVIGDVIPLVKLNTGATDGSNNPGDGRPIYFVLQITEQIITGGSAGTIQFFLVSDHLSTLGGGVLASTTEHARSISILTDDATAVNADTTPGGLINRVGKVVMCLPLPQVLPYEKYLGVLCTVGTTTTTAGKINAFLTDDPSRWRPYADAI